MIQKLFGKAVELHRNGKLSEAAIAYRQILASDPLHAGSLHMLGTLAHNIGNEDVAVELIRKAISIDKRNASFHANLGTALQAQGKLDDAATSYRRALAINPDLAEAHMNLGVVLQARGRLLEAEARFKRSLALKPKLVEAHINLGNVQQALGKLEEAVASHQQAIALRPDFAEAWFNLGNDLQALERLDEAVSSYQRALTFKPGMAEIHGNLGNALLALNKWDEAVACFQRALELKPDYADACYNLGNTRYAQAEFTEAIACYRQAVTLKPEFPEAHYNLGNTHVALDDLEAALACFERTLALSPAYAQAHYNIGCVLQSLGRLNQAFAHYEKALRLQPDFPQARFGHALAQIFNGQYDPGWRNYESRWRSIDHDTPMRDYPQPAWNGESLPAGRTLLWGEQGVGDEIMFAGLIPDALRSGNSFLLDCDRRLQPLFARSFPGLQVIAGLDCLPPTTQSEIVAHLPTGSLPGLFRANQAAFASTTAPYLIPDPTGRAMFRARYADGRRVIGLAWYTSNQKTGRKRSIDLSRFAPLFRIPGIRWVSLQYGEFDKLEAQASAASAPLFVDRSVDQFSDLDLFASQVAAMDLVITIDNSTAHLTGALGIPTWLLLPFVPDWRWLQSGDSSSWYPSMRLFRQPALNDWQSVIRTVESELRAAV